MVSGILHICRRKRRAEVNSEGTLYTATFILHCRAYVEENEITSKNNIIQPDC